MIDIRQLPNLTIEQKNFVDRFYSQFDFAPAGSGLLRHIANVEPVLYEGAIFGSEFQTFAVTKLYLCFSILCSCNAVAGIVSGNVNFRDGGVILIYVTNQSICYDSIAPAINYAKNNYEIKNLWFSHLNNIQYTDIKFIGYRITLD